MAALRLGVVASRSQQELELRSGGGLSAGPRRRASVGGWRQQRQQADGGSSDSGRMAAAATASGWQQRRWLVAGGGDGAGQRVCGSSGMPRAGAAAATSAADLARATGRGPRRQCSDRSDGGDELVPACGSGLVGPTDFFFVFLFSENVCRVLVLTHGKTFAECAKKNTWQRCPLPTFVYRV